MLTDAVGGVLLSSFSVGDFLFDDDDRHHRSYKTEREE